MTDFMDDIIASTAKKILEAAGLPTAGKTRQQLLHVAFKVRKDSKVAGFSESLAAFLVVPTTLEYMTDKERKALRERVSE